MPLVLGSLAVALVATAALGPMGLGLLVWRVSPSGLIQLYGAHIAELLLVVPATLTAAWLWPRAGRRDRGVAPALALGAGGYALYVSVQFVLFPDYSLYTGNNERFFLLFLTSTVLSWVALVRAWAALNRRAIDSVSSPSRRLKRAFAFVVLATNGLIGSTWLSQVLGIAGGALPPGYADSPTGFWLIRLVDLGVVIPLSVVSAVALLRGHSAGIRTAPAVASLLTLEVGAVLAMGVAQLWLGDHTASLVLVFLLGFMFLGIASTTTLLLRHLSTAALVANPGAVHLSSQARRSRLAA